MKIPKYIQKIIEMKGTNSAGKLNLEPGLHILRVEHDDWCSFFKNGNCNCNPNTKLQKYRSQDRSAG